MSEGNSLEKFSAQKEEVLSVFAREGQGTDMILQSTEKLNGLILSLVKANQEIQTQMESSKDQRGLLEKIRSNRKLIEGIKEDFAKSLEDLDLQEGITKVVEYITGSDNTLSGIELSEFLELSDRFNFENPAVFLGVLVYIFDLAQKNEDDSSEDPNEEFFNKIIGGDEYIEGDEELLDKNALSGLFDNLSYVTIPGIEGNDLAGQIAKELLIFSISRHGFMDREGSYANPYLDELKIQREENIDYDDLSNKTNRMYEIYETSEITPYNLDENKNVREIFKGLQEGTERIFDAVQEYNTDLYLELISRLMEVIARYRFIDINFPETLIGDILGEGNKDLSGYIEHLIEVRTSAIVDNVMDILRGGLEGEGANFDLKALGSDSQGTTVPNNGNTEMSFDFESDLGYLDDDI